jgi:BNR/Asp-box repeat
MTSLRRPARRVIVVLGLAVCTALVMIPQTFAAHGGNREVTDDSIDNFFSRNKQNEPTVQINPINTDIVVAGANDNIDMELCNAGDDTTCPFTPNVGGTGIQISLNRGDTWTQPTYSGLTARHCTGAPGPDPDCVVRQGLIGTLPKYDDLNIVSDGDPAVAFGPRRSNGTFSWSNGERLYFANLTSNVTADFGEPGFKGFEAIAVSRTDNLVSAAAGNESAWMPPVIASKQSSATFSDKEQIWADNAASSDFFGNVYVCYAAFRGSGAAPLVVSTSRNGGATWETDQVSPAHNVAPKLFGQSGCTIRTDSEGTAYVFYEEFENPTKPSVGFPPRARHKMVRSFDGGETWSRPRTIQEIIDPCFFVDPVIGRCVMDGIAGARSDLAAAPSIDIANGTPTGGDATDLIVLTWVDGRDGLNGEDVMIRWSRDQGVSWSPPRRVSTPPDRGYYSAVALSPDGRDLYLVYNAFTTPFRNNTTQPRTLVGVVRHAEVGANGPTAWTTLQRGAPGDARASSQNDLQAEFLGDYVYASATRDYAAAVWNDVREGAVCTAINTWRAALQEGESPTPPRPNIDCPAKFGNTDIFGWSGTDPSTP